jgi:hypothetical protein
MPLFDESCWEGLLWMSSSTCWVPGGMLSAIIEGAATNVVIYHGGWCLHQQVDLTCNPNKEQRIDLSSVVHKVREKFSHGVITYLLG